MTNFLEIFSIKGP